MDWTGLVKQRLEDLGITQDQLGERIGVTQGGLGHWLNNRRQPPFEMLGRIADELGIDRAVLGAAVLGAATAPLMAKTPFHRAMLEICSNIPPGKQERFLGWLEAKIEDFIEPESLRKKLPAAAAKSA